LVNQDPSALNNPRENEPMNISDEDFCRLLRELMSGQKLAVLSTHNGGQPYASLVAFACSEDLGSLYFVTPRTTRKFSNLHGDCRMALLVTSSANQETDFHEAMAVTVVGSAAEIHGPDKEAALNHYIAKHPYLEDFARSPTCAFVKVHPRTYILVKNFQHVMELHVAS
jgi:nitroimidazol reductase NimA-like FMN-containing flavoprotein (pyridoxamine 5'-phosphate oxidase superfamily)